jgi:flagellar biosynthesis/type III secretory pathway protein FliH
MKPALILIGLVILAITFYAAGFSGGKKNEYNNGYKNGYLEGYNKGCDDTRNYIIELLEKRFPEIKK